jgi:hypothetical protein
MSTMYGDLDVDVYIPNEQCALNTLHYTLALASPSINMNPDQTNT